MNANQALHQATLSKWTAIFREQQASGLNIKEWCSQNNISIHSFYYWKRIAKEEYLKSVMPEIVPIPIPSAPLPSLPEDPAPSAAPGSQDLNNSNNLANSNNLYSSDNLANFKKFNNSSDTVPLSIPISISMGDIRIEIGASAPDDLIARIIGVLKNA